MSTLEASLEWRDDNLIRTLGCYVVDRQMTNPEALAPCLNRDFRDGVLRGVANATVTPEGRVLDDRRRPYAVHEIELLMTLPSTQEFIAELRKERELEAQDARHQEKVEQLAHARAIKAARHDRSAVPALYAEVAELRRLVTWLVDGMDRQMGVMPLKDKPQWVLPEIPD
jgi:hypothetical protein